MGFCLERASTSEIHVLHRLLRGTSLNRELRLHGESVAIWSWRFVLHLSPQFLLKVDVCDVEEDELKEIQSISLKNRYPLSLATASIPGTRGMSRRTTG